MCKSKLGHKKLEKITLGITEGTRNFLADFVTLDHFWSGQTNFNSQNWSGQTILVRFAQTNFHPKSVRPDHFTQAIFSVTEHQNFTTVWRLFKL